MADGESFGEVRAVVHGASTHIAWAELCLLLERSDPESYHSRMEPYLLDTMSSWPDEVRVAPTRWLVAACRGLPTPWLGLARHLYVSREVLGACAPPVKRGRGRATLYMRGVTALVACEQLRGVTVLDVTGQWDDDRHFRALCGADVFEGVRELEIAHQQTYTSQGQDLTPYGAFAGSPLSRGLERLEIALGTSDDGAFERWGEGLASGDLGPLRALALKGTTSALSEVLECLMRSRALGGLESLSVEVRAELERDVDVTPDDMPGLRALRLAISSPWNCREPQEQAGRVARLLGSCDASRLRAFELESVDLRGGGMRGVLDAFGSEGALEELRLVRCEVEPDEARELAAFDGFGALRALDLAGNDELGPRGARALLDGLAAPGLEALCLRDVGLKSKWLDGLARFGSLRELDLSGKNAIREAGGEVVSRLPALEFAVLERAGLNATGLAALCGAASGPLTFLDVRANRLGRAGVQALVESDLRPQVLYLGREQVTNDLDAECMRLLTGWDGLDGVRVLSVCNSKLKQKDLMILLRSERLRGLEYLDISCNSLGKAGAIAFAECDHLGGLRGLGVSSCGLRRPGFEALSRVTFLTRLAFLSISGNSIDPVMFNEIWPDAAARFPALEWLDEGWYSEAVDEGGFGYARMRLFAKQTSTRWLAPWMLPTSVAQPTYLSRWERG